MVRLNAYHRCLGALLPLLLLASLAVADSVVTENDLRIEGRIVREDDDQVILSTEYGELRFLKIRLKSITRGSAPAPQSSGGGFGAPPPSAFGGFGAPVGGPPGGAPAFGADPFGGSFADPFGFAAATPAVPVPTPTPSPIPQRPRTLTPARDAAPVVPAGAAGVLFGVTEDHPSFVRRPGSDWSPIREDFALQSSMEIQTRDLPTTRFHLAGRDGDEIRLAHESQVRLGAHDSSGNTTTIVLQRGAIWVNLARPTGANRTLIVSTTELTATASSPALFIVDRTLAASRVTVASGTVLIRADATGVQAKLAAGQSAVVNVPGQMIGALPAPIDVSAAWANWDGTPLTDLLPLASLNAVIAESNARWESEMQSYSRTLAELQYQERLNTYSEAFMRLAADTGVIPESADGWSWLRFNPGIDGWAGPYLDEPVPPLDPWKRPLVYRRLVSSSGNDFGRVYSLWQDGIDQGGENTSADKVSLIMYFNLEQFRRQTAERR
jgi:hypothetical protein